MRKLILSALITAGLIFTGANSFAAGMQIAQASKKEKEAPAEKKAPAKTEVKGKVTNFDQKSGTLTITDETGKAQTLGVAFPEALSDVRVGDKVALQIENGKVTAIEKEGMKGKSMKGNMSEEQPKENRY